MTSSQWFDLAVVAVALVAAISGWLSGALGSLLAFVGVVLGAVAGVLLAPHVVSHITGSRTKLFVTLFLILALVVIGEIAGVVLGRAVRGAIRNPALRFFDSVIGVGLLVVAVLVVAWLLGTLLGSSDLPKLAAAVRGSTVLAQVDEVAPSWLRSVPTRLKSALWDTSGLPDVLKPFGRTPIVAVDAPDAGLAGDHDLVVRPRTRPCGRREPVTDLHPLDRLDRHQRGGQSGVELAIPLDVGAEAGRHPVGQDLEDPAHAVLRLS